MPIPIVLSVAAFRPQWQKWVVVTETDHITLWPFKKKFACLCYYEYSCHEHSLKVFVWTFAFIFLSVPRTGIAGSYGDCILKYIRKLSLYGIKFIKIAGHMIGVTFKYVRNCFIQSDSIILYFHHQCIRVIFSPYPLKLAVLPGFKKLFSHSGSCIIVS